MTSNRRTFLKSLGIGAGALALSNGLFSRVANAASDRSFVFCYFNGGWDTLLSLDPRDPDLFTEARVPQTRIQLAWDRLAPAFQTGLVTPEGSNITFGPAAQPIARHFDKMCVLRGMSMDTVAHEIGRMYFLTGLMPRAGRANGPSIPARIVGQQGNLSLAPHLACSVETYSEGLPAYAAALAVNTVQDLQLSLTELPNARRSDHVKWAIESYRSRAKRCDHTNLDRDGFLSTLKESQTKAKELIESDVAGRFQFTANNAEMRELNGRYGIGNNLGGGGAQAAMAYQALRYEVAQSVSVQLTTGLDTHFENWATQQAPLQAAGFTALAQLVDDLATTPDPSRGGMLLDHTTILAFSEFGRTTLLNTRDGRDHSLTSSAMLIGAGVPHNRVIGASSDVGMNPMRIDPTTGETDSSGVFVTPTNIAASMMESAALDPDTLREVGLPCLKA